ncbi:MAG: hypothetical protein O2854_04730 [Chloroflexi bacterium]|nr:hypothetical protein [Chloroflexota bacterium]
MQNSGMALLIVSALALVGYLSYVFWIGVILAPDVPLIIKVAIPAGAAGLFVLLVSVTKDRLRMRKHENLDEVRP